VRRARAGLGRSFQSLELFEDATVFDNLRAASDPRDVGSYLRDLIWPFAPPIPGQVVSAIEEFRLQEDLNRLVESLPYGQRRLLAIARAVATRPSVLLLDEPAAGLGDVESAELAVLVRRLATDWGMGILLVEHDMDFVMSVCDELVVLDFGRKIAQGTPAVVRADPAVIAAYLGEEEEDAVDTGLPHVAVSSPGDAESAR
jgi:ABC-type branched-subunit amino acid transport system ATPase component